MLVYHQPEDTALYCFSVPIALVKGLALVAARSFMLGYISPRVYEGSVVDSRQRFNA